MTKPVLSVVILSYNTSDLLGDCLESLRKVRNELYFEVVVVDNGSTDNSVDLVEKKYPEVKLIKTGKNLGFAAGNNKAKKLVKGKYVLFLNSDTLVHKNTIKESYWYMQNNENVGAMTCKLLLADGSLDKDTRRAFITPWIGLVHLLLRLDRLFPKSKLLAKYWYGYIPDNKEHEVDVIQGAYLFIRKKILDDIGWFDESYFLDGEDIELCWQIKKRGWKIIYYPKVTITHYKGATKGKLGSGSKKSVSIREKLKFRMAGVESMERFYKKHLWQEYPMVLNMLVLLAIKIIKIMRMFKTVLIG